MDQTTNSEAQKKFWLRRHEFSIFVAQAEAFTGEVLCRLLKAEGYNVVGRAQQMDDALQQISVKQPQCVILDAELSDKRSFDVVKQARASDARTRFILYTSRPDLKLVASAMQTGFMGYIHASDGLEELYRCFQTVSNGASYYSTGFLSLLKNYGVDVVDDNVKNQLAKLSSREREVLRLIADGHPTDAIADMLHISYRTVTNHKANMARKLELSSLRQLPRYGAGVKNYL